MLRLSCMFMCGFQASRRSASIFAWPAVYGAFWLLLAPEAMTSPAAMADDSEVHFDVPAIVVAEPIDPSLVRRPMMGGSFVRLRIPVSAYVPAGNRDEIVEYSVEFRSPSETLRVVDFWPRNEVYSDVAGTISVESAEQRQGTLKLSGSAGIEPIARGSLDGEYRTEASKREKFERIPPAQSLTSSGTIARGYGVFFKFRPGPSPDLEGARDVAILAEVPAGWRADTIHVAISVTGKSSFGSGLLRQSQMWMTVHQEGDLAAAARARRFVTQERALRALAASRAAEIKDKSLPTVLHKIGAALEIVQPRIPADYLSHVIFGPRNQYLEGGAHRLPMDLRIAILDYWDARESLMRLAHPQQSSDPSVARHTAPHAEHQQSNQVLLSDAR